MEDSFDGTFTDNIKSQAYKSQFANKKHKVIINVSETQYAVVKHIAKKNKWNQIVDPASSLNFDLCWIDGIARQDLFARMNQYQKINHFPGMGILSRKNNLGKNLMLFRRKFPSDYEFFPITWHLPTDYNDLEEYHDCRQQGKAQTFIVKPEAGCQGRGIFLTRNIEKLKNEKCVVQRYLHKPYLIDGLKFDLRIYVLVTGIDPLRIFVYQQGLARFATQPYKPPRSENLENLFMHLTNYAINKNSQKFIFNESVTDMNTGHKRSLTSIFKHIEEEGHDIELLKERIYDLFIKTIITGYPTLSQTLASCHPDNHANDMCFEILGFDIMLDHKLNPYILEINYTPSFTADTPLDRHIKKNLIQDTLNLIGVNDKWKKQAKAKRDKQTQERMLSGKRKKYTSEERTILMREQAKKRDAYEMQNLGRYKKIFILNQQQFLEYKKYYDFAMEIYLNMGKNELYSSYQKPLTNPIIFYNNYFDRNPHFVPKQKKIRESERQSLKNTSENNGKYNDPIKRGHHISSSQKPVSSSMKRVCSAKSQNHKNERRVIDSGELKQSTKLVRSKSIERHQMQRSSIFQNKMLQKIGTGKNEFYQEYEIEGY